MKIKLHNQIFIGMLLGILAGLILNEKAALFQPIGDIFVRLLRMIIVPLILSSIVMGIAGIGDIRNLGKIGAKTFLYYLVTTFVSVVLGLIVVNLIKPGFGMSMHLGEIPELARKDPPSILSILVDIVPKNAIDAMARGQMLSVIFFALVLGAGISAVGDKGNTVASFFDGLNSVMMKLTGWFMKLAPLGVFALLAVIVGRTGLSVLKPLGLYMATVLLGLLIHGAIVLPVILYFVARISPARFFRQMIPALATSFSTASSAATLPITMDCLRERTKVSNKVTSFVLPLGATINMDGTALYEAVAALFIAQAYGVELSLAQMIVVSLTATMASIGAAAIPGAGLITMVIVLKAVNLPIEGIGLIIAVDRILDMCRTSINVWGDSCGTAVIAKTEGEALSSD